MASGDARSGPLDNSVKNALQDMKKMIYMDKTISWCNGMEPRSFKNADIGYSKRLTQNGVYLQYLFQPGIKMIEKHIDSKSKSESPGEIQRLFAFLKEADIHAKAIIQNVSADRYEATLTALLAVHLFQKLLPDKVVKVDEQQTSGMKKLNNNCPCQCGGTFNTESTGIGASRVWHGYPDMLLCGIPVTVAQEIDDEEEDCEHEGPVPKKLRLEIEYGNGTCVEVKTGSIKEESVVHQVIAQTITSAFAQVNEKQKLEDTFIPAICISARDVTFFAYNVKFDWLISTIDVRSLFSGGKFDLKTIIEIWLILNMRVTAKSAQHFSADGNKFEPSGFQTLMEKNDCLDVYRRAEVHLEKFSFPVEPPVKFYNFTRCSMNILTS